MRISKRARHNCPKMTSPTLPRATFKLLDRVELIGRPYDSFGGKLYLLSSTKSNLIGPTTVRRAQIHRHYVGWQNSTK